MKKTDFDLEQYLFFWAGQTAALYSRNVTKALKPLDVNLATWRILALIEKKGVMAVSEFADFSGLERSALSRAVSAMEEKGLIVRVDRKEDKRMMNIQITQAGSDLYYKILPTVERCNQKYLHNLDDEEIKVAIKILKKVRANF